MLDALFSGGNYNSFYTIFLSGILLPILLNTFLLSFPLGKLTLSGA